MEINPNHCRDAVAANWEFMPEAERHVFTQWQRTYLARIKKLTRDAIRAEENGDDKTFCEIIGSIKDVTIASMEDNAK